MFSFQAMVALSHGGHESFIARFKQWALLGEPTKEPPTPNGIQFWFLVFQTVKCLVTKLLL